MTIRKAIAERDSGEICAIYNRYVAETTISFETVPLSCGQMEERISGIAAHFPYYVCELDGKIAGYCYAHPWKERAAYSKTLETTIYLSPEAKGRGIGRRLMERLIDDCRRLGFHSLIACITAENTGSIAFHRALGFEQVSLFREVGFKFGRWLDVADLELLL